MLSVDNRLYGEGARPRLPPRAICMYRNVNYLNHSLSHSHKAGPIIDQRLSRHMDRARPGNRLVASMGLDFASLAGRSPS